MANPKVFDLDRACAAIRQFQAGKASLSVVGQALADASSDQLEVISIAVRLPVSRLQTLRRLAGAQTSLPV